MPKPLPPILASLLALLVLVGVAAATTSPAQAAATAKPCWERVIDDWLDNGTIDGTYKPSCYREALKHVPEDLRDYSGIGDAIAAALQSSLRGQDGPVGSVQNVGSGGASAKGKSAESSTGLGGASANSMSAESGTGSSRPPAGQQRMLQVAPDRSYYRRAIDDLGPTSAESVPIPLLVLAGLGTLLLLTAGGLAARKRLRSGGERRGSADGR